MTPDAAIEFVRDHGVVLESAKGPVPNLVDAIAGSPVKGSWWGHARGREIFRLLRHVRESPEVLTCTLVRGKITFVHRRLWPHLVAAASNFPADRLAWIRESHTAEGRHVREAVPYPAWVPSHIGGEAEKLSPREALSAVGYWRNGAG